MALSFRRRRDRRDPRDGTLVGGVRDADTRTPRSSRGRRLLFGGAMALLAIAVMVGAGVAIPGARQAMPTTVVDVAQDVAQGVAQAVVDPVTDPGVACSRFYDAVWGGSSRRWSDARVASELIGLQAATAGEGDGAMHRDLNAIEAATTGAARQERVVATLDRCRSAGHLTDGQIARLREAAKARIGSTVPTQR